MSNPPTTFNVTFNDPAGTYTPYYAGIRSSIIGAGLEWAKYINGSGSSGSLDVSVNFALTGTPEATGGSYFSGSNSESDASIKLRTGLGRVIN
jgi:hypothetical protein